MNSKVHPLVATFVILFAIAAVAVWVWATGRAKEFGGPAELLTDPSGHLYVQMQNFLLEHDEDGQFLRRHDLSDVGVESVLGGMGFFSNGDILLRRGTDDRTVLENIRAYFRLDNERSVESNSDATGLSRCDLGNRVCEPFGNGGIDFRAAFGVFIDKDGDDVYVSDTTRHKLRKYSWTGQPLATADGGYRFPNQLRIHDGRLYVANTNHHEIRVVDPASDDFGREISKINVVPAAASQRRQIWPSHFAKVGDSWWVNNMRSNMANGGVYIFDANWNFQVTVGLPADADPISILPFGGEVLISDWNNDRIHRVLVNGVRVGDFSSSGLDELISESEAQRWQYQAIAYTALVALGLLVLGLLVVGLAAGKDAGREEATPRKDPAPPEDNELVWLTPDPAVIRKLRFSIWAASIAVLALLPLAGIIVAQTDYRLARAEFLVPLLGIVAIFLPIIWASRSNISSAIGLRGSEVLLRDHTGRETALPVSKIMYTDTAIAGPDAAVFLGRHQMAIYSRDDLDARLFPRLADAQRVSAWQMQRLLLKMRHPTGVATVLVFAGAAIAGIAVGLFELVP